MIDRHVLRAERGFRGDPPRIDPVELADLECTLQMELVGDDDERRPSLLQQLVAEIADLLEGGAGMCSLHYSRRNDPAPQQLASRHLRARKLVRRMTACEHKELDRAGLQQIIACVYTRA